MQHSTEEVLQSFRLLPENQKLAVASEVLRWARETEYSDLTLDDMTSVAAELFVALDEDEQADG